MATLVFGHKNPDTDSITSTLVITNLPNKIRYGRESLPFR